MSRSVVVHFASFITTAVALSTTTTRSYESSNNFSKGYLRATIKTNQLAASTPSIQPTSWQYFQYGYLAFYQNKLGSTLTCSGGPISYLYYSSGSCTLHMATQTSTSIYVEPGLPVTIFLTARLFGLIFNIPSLDSCLVTQIVYSGLTCSGSIESVKLLTLNQFFGIPDSATVNSCYNGYVPSCSSRPPVVHVVNSVRVE